MSHINFDNERFYADYGEEGDSTVKEGKVLGLSQSLFNNPFEMDVRMAFHVLLDSISVT